MSSSFEQRAEERLIQAVRQRRRQRQSRVMIGGALALCLGVWLALQQRAIPVETSSESQQFAEQTDSQPSSEPVPKMASPVPAESPKPYTLISTQTQKFTPIESSSTRLVIVRTGEFPSAQNIDDRELFAQLPDARIQIDSEGQAELIVPEPGNQ